MTNKLMLADGFDILSYVLLQNISTSEVLDWVYTSVLIISVLFGIVLKIIAAVKDRHVTKEELTEIKNEVDKAVEELNKHDKDK